MIAVAPTTIAGRRAEIINTISAITDRPVRLVAASKYQSDDRLEAALVAGQRVFGENRVQEALIHWRDRKPSLPDLELHLIGPLQTNKAVDAVALFDVIETLDRPKLAKELAKAIEKAGRNPEIYIQVNTGEEAQKAGVPPAGLHDLLELATQDYGLNVAGLMCIPPADEPAGPHFALLAKLAKTCGLANLSMGMSSDFETAIRFGATHVRVGTGLFGPRPDPEPTE